MKRCLTGMLMLLAVAGCQDEPELVTVGRAVIPVGAVGRLEGSPLKQSNICTLELPLQAPPRDNEDALLPEARTVDPADAPEAIRLAGERRVRIATAGYVYEGENSDAPVLAPELQDQATEGAEAELTVPPDLLPTPLTLDVRARESSLTAGQTCHVTIRVRNESSEPVSQVIVVLVPSPTLTYGDLFVPDLLAGTIRKVDSPDSDSLRFLVDREIPAGRGIVFGITLTADF